MFKQILQNSLAVLRRPTVKSFQEVNVDNWRWGFIYLAIGEALAIILRLISNQLRAAALEQQRLTYIQRFGSNGVASFLSLAQNPFFNIALGVFSFFLGILLSIALPYWLGRAFGGSKSFGRLVYNHSLFSTPMLVLNSLLALIFNGSLLGLFVFLSLSIDAIRAYFIYVNLRAVMGLTRGQSAFAVFVPIAIEISLVCSVILFFVIGTLHR